MKIRWTRGSLRLRITPTEMEAITYTEPIGETLRLAGWQVQVVPTEGLTELRADGPMVTIALSALDAARLAEPEREGIYFDQDGDPPLRYFIEKDFPCIHPHAMEALETPTETFPEPVGFRERKNNQ